MSSYNLTCKLAPEVRMTMNTEEGHVFFQSPWLDAELELDEVVFADSKSTLELIKQRLPISAEQLHPEARELLWLPFFEVGPEFSPATTLQTGSIASEYLESISNRALAVLTNIDAQTHVLPSEMEFPNGLLTSVTRVVSASEDLSIGLCDPVAAFSAIRLEALRYESSLGLKARLKSELDNLASCDSVLFRDASVELIRSAHLATRLCGPILGHAVTLYENHAVDLLSFIQDERGHDALMAQSLRGLGIDDPAEVPVRSEAILALGALATSVEAGPFALACLISAFEGYTAQDEDAVASALRKHGHGTAAIGLERHLAINNEGEHHDFGRSLISKMSNVSVEEVTVAAKLTFVKTFAECALLGSILKDFSTGALNK